MKIILQFWLSQGKQSGITDDGQLSLKTQNNQHKGQSFASLIFECSSMTNHLVTTFNTEQC